MTFKTFNDFYPYYLGEHSNLTCRKLHFIGTSGVVALILVFFFTGKLQVLWLLPLIGYGFAWVGHFIFEKNRPATFKHPFYSLLGDFRMFWDILTGKLKAF
ncbi:MAG: Mpo1-like protein [Bacteriovoracaceae bacterium]